MTESDQPPERVEFPAGFLWGTATAAYQIEGAFDEAGRGPSVWDDFSHDGNCHRSETGDVTCDHYHRWHEDVEIMRRLGLKAYRLSISWSRILPQGADCQPNEAGIAFYRRLLEALHGAGIEPMVTLFHWDMPSALEARGGWLSRDIVGWFQAYARLCFERFGDLVRLWCTLNEPSMVCVLGYCLGVHAPGRKEAPGVEPYLAGHHMLLAHAAAVSSYRSEFASTQHGEIGIALNTEWFFPKDPEDASHRALCERAVAFSLGWFAEPLRTGQYPTVMRRVVGDRLPEFTAEESSQLLGSFDWLGINHYSSRVLGGWRGLSGTWKDLQTLSYTEGGIFGSLSLGLRIALSGQRHLISDIGLTPGASPDAELTDMGWPIVPEGIEALLRYVSSVYAPRCGVYVTENGVALPGESNLAQAMQDGGGRVDFLRKYIGAVGDAVVAGADVRGYFLWTLLDNFEWAYGTSKRFGIVHVDFQDPALTRRLKPSALWYAEVAATNVVVRQPVLPPSSRLAWLLSCGCRPRVQQPCCCWGGRRALARNVLNDSVASDLSTCVVPTPPTPLLASQTSDDASVPAAEQ